MKSECTSFVVFNRVCLLKKMERDAEKGRQNLFKPFRTYTFEHLQRVLQ